MAQMTSEVCKLLEEALMLPLEDQEVLANSLLSHLSERVDEEVQAAWDEEIKRRIDEIKSGKAKMIPWEEVRARNLKKLPHAR